MSDTESKSSQLASWTMELVGLNFQAAAVISVLQLSPTEVHAPQLSFQPPFSLQSHLSFKNINTKYVSIRIDTTSHARVRVSGCPEILPTPHPPPPPLF